MQLTPLSALWTDEGLDCDSKGKGKNKVQHLL